MVCANCNNALAAGQAFCPNCGTRGEAAPSQPLPRVETDVPVVLKKKPVPTAAASFAPPATNGHGSGAVVPPPAPGQAPTAAMPAVHPAPTALVAKQPAPPAPPAAPPAGLVMPGDRDPFFVRHRWSVLGGALAVLAIATVAVILLASGGSKSDDTATRTASLLSQSRQKFDVPLDQATSAVKLAELRSAGQAAQRTTPEIDTIIQQVSLIEQARYRAPADRLLQAEKRLLTELAPLANLSQKGLQKTLRTIEPKLAAAQTELTAAAAAVTGLRMTGTATSPSVPDAARVDGAVRNVGTVIEGADRKLRAYAVALRRARRQQAKIAQNSRGTSGYQGQMAALIEDYFRDRDVSRAWYNRADSMSMSELSSAISSSQADRRGTISAMAALTPPASVADEHREIISLVEGSLSGLAMAQEAVNEYLTGPESSVTYTSSWQRFDAQSNSVTSRFGPAKSRWQAAASAASSEGNRKVRMPKKPSV